MGKKFFKTPQSFEEFFSYKFKHPEGVEIYNPVGKVV